MEKKKLYDLVGIACLVILLFILVFSHVQANKSQKLDLPDDAQTLTASADGKVGPVEVEVIANQSEIFKVRVTNHTETDGIGTNAVDQIPGAIVEKQSLAVDAVAGATITSEAIQKAVADAMTGGGIDPSAFGFAAAAEEPAVEPEPAAEPAAASAEPAAEGGAGYVPGTYTGEGTGMGKVYVNVTVDESSITAVEIDGSGETPEIGGAAVGTLTEQVLAAQGAGIDGVAGASLTSEAVRTAVAAALAEAAVPAEATPAAAAVSPEAAPAAPAEGAGYVPGTYTAEAQGMGKVIVNVTVDESSITAIEIDGSGETPGIGAAAVDPLKEQVLAAQSAVIDGVAGATITSTAVRTAVEAALAEAAAGDAAQAESAEPEAEVVPASVTEAPKGTVTETGSGQGIDGPVVVQVTADAEKIYSVEVLEQNETPGIGSVAVEKLPGAIVEANSLLVDGISGATVTSTAIKTAITEALTKAGLDASVFEKELAAAEPVEKTEETIECDVVVVGAGGAGLTAAVRANQEGAKVLVLEKMPMVGGNSNRAEGGMNAAGTKLEAELGLDDSTVENFTADTLRLGHDLANPDLVRTLAENSSDAIDWLGSIGAPFTDVHATGGCEGRKYLHQPEGGRAVGEYLVEKLSAVAEEQGIEIKLNTKATEILMEDGKAVGVKAEDDSTVYTVKAKAVVLATGGFGANFELMASYDPSLANAVTTNHSGATGDGIMMAQAIGADTVDMEQIQLHPTVIQENGLLVSESLRSKGAIIVNTEGKRFVNDLAGRDVVSQAELKQPDGYCFIIFDQNLVDGLALAEKFIDRGYAIRGETYEELAENMGLSEEAVKNFAQTMETWNAAVAADEDKEFGRKGMTDDLSTAPFYAIKIAPGIHHTMGGIKINTEAQVIDTDGNVIPGLYAAGETTGGIHGGNRVGGNAVCDFVVFGRISGANAAAFANGGTTEATPASEVSAGMYVPGTYTADAMGMGKVVVNVTVDENSITAIEIDGSGETPGIGAAAVEPLQEQVLAAQSAEVDGVAGATITSNAVRTAVAAALEEAMAAGNSAAAPAEAAEPESEAAPASEERAGMYMPGTYTAEAQGMGKVVVNVTVDENSITAIEIDGSGETPGIGAVAIDPLKEQVLAAQSAVIDGIAGATITSTAVRTAVEAALAEAAAGAASDAAPVEEAESAAESAGKYIPGTYQSEAMGMGKVVVSVTVDENGITAVEIDGSGETPGIGAAAVEPLQEQVLAAQSAEVDGVAGATITSNAVRTAVAAALEEAMAA